MPFFIIDRSLSTTLSITRWFPTDMWWKEIGVRTCILAQKGAKIIPQKECFWFLGLCKPAYWHKIYTLARIHFMEVNKLQKEKIALTDNLNT